MSASSAKRVPIRRGRSSAPARVHVFEVANAAGVSAMTVSRALRDPGRVAAPTLARVQRAIDALGYVPHGVASALASRRSRIVAAIVPTLYGSVYGTTLEGLGAVLRRAGHELMLGHSGYDAAAEAALVQAFVGRGVDAIVLTGVEHSPVTNRLIRHHRLPVAEIWDLRERPLGLVVGFSNVAAGRAAGEHFARRGRRQWAFLGSLPEVEHRSGKRLEGFRQAARDAGLAAPVVCPVEYGMVMAEGYAAARELLARHPDIDALFCANDGLAGAAIAAAHDAGRAMPRDLALIGLGDFDIAAHLRPALTTIRIPGRRIGELTGERLLAWLHGARPAGRSIDVGFELVCRASA